MSREESRVEEEQTRVLQCIDIAIYFVRKSEPLDGITPLRRN